MITLRMHRRTLAIAFLVALSGSLSLMAQKLTYPTTRTSDQIDTYFGEQVADPYRWLEDENAPETKRWVEAENAVTSAYLDRIPFRAQVKERLRALIDYPRYGAPVRRGDSFFFSKNDGLQNQSVVYRQRGLDGTPDVLLDPNSFSTDQTMTLGAFQLSKDGRLAAYCKAEGGSDWLTCYVLDTTTKATLSDELKWVKVSDIAWAGDGFFYSRYPAPEPGRELTAQNEGHQVYFHRVGTPQSADRLVFEDPANPQRFHTVSTTEDERFAILTVSDRGRGKDGNAIYFRDLSLPQPAWVPIVSEITNDSYEVIDHVGAGFLIHTNAQAPNWKIVRYDPSAAAGSRWADVLPERPEPIQSVGTAGGKLLVTYLKDVTSRAFVYALDGTLENEITLPDLGIAGGFGGRVDDTFVFYTFTSFTYPPAIFRYDLATRRSELFRAASVAGYRADDFQTEQVFVTSKDGTRVPMFLVHRKGLVLDGMNPTLMYGYGGFNVPVTPSFSALRIGLLEQGVVYASVNLRGGSEYGEAWHQGGMKLKKQNVFDDFIAAAEWLVAHKYTSSSRLAIQGASNGGLLVGVVANQRPDLFRAVIQQAGVMDMLRFQKFTIGWNWIADYGSSDDEAEFRVLRGYSPYHNITPGVRYPAILTTTADHDDRVVPAHSFKYAAALQAAQAGEWPVLIRIDVQSAHGASNTEKSIEQAADIQSFLYANLGVVPVFARAAVTQGAARP